jgi:hypothetical protein
MTLSIGTFGWRQIAGDMNPAAHGGTIATGDGERLELLKIQPLRAYIGDHQALEVGHPFWTREACYDLADLRGEGLYSPETIASALRYVGLEDLEEYAPEARALAIAAALLDYGYADEGPAGWARDILGDTRAKWWGSKRPRGWRYLADEDVEFRALQREGGAL